MAAVACNADAQNGFVFLSPAAASGILVQPPGATTECEVDRARTAGPRHVGGLRLGMRKRKTTDATLISPLTPISPYEVS